MGATLAPPDERLAALRKANEVKQARIALLARLKAKPLAVGCEFAADLVEEAPDVLGSMFVIELVEKIRSLPGDDAELLLTRADVEFTATVGELDANTRARLGLVLRQRAVKAQVWRRKRLRAEERRGRREA